MSEALMGTLAGGVATRLRIRAKGVMVDHGNPAARRLIEAVRPGGMDPPHVIANKMAVAMGTERFPKRLHAAGMQYVTGKVSYQALCTVYREIVFRQCLALRQPIF